MLKLSLLTKTMLLVAVLYMGGVNSAWADTTYKLTKVTSVTAGNKYVFERNSRVFNNTVSNNALQTTKSYVTTGLKGTETYVWTLERATNGYYLKNVSLSSNQYLNNSNSTNVAFSTKSSVWSIVFTDGVALISNTSNSNRFLGETGANSNAYKAYATSNLNNNGHDITVYILEEEAAADPTKTTPELSFLSESYTVDLEDGFTAPTLTNEQDVTVEYSSSDTNVATVDAATGAVTLVGKGTTIITAAFDGTNDATYNSASASYTLKVTTTETLPFSETFASSFGDFTVTPDASLGNLWVINNSYVKASAYLNNAQNAGESWLISPVIALDTYATLSFSHSSRYFVNIDAMKDEATLWIREFGGEWQQLTIDVYPGNENTNDFVEASVNLAAYKDKKIQLGFKYLGNTTSAGSWCIKNLTIADTRGEAPIAFEAETVYKVLKDKDSYTGQALTNEEYLAVSYSSSNTEVATVNAETGEVAIIAVGEAHISATYADSPDYKETVASYKLVVTNKAIAAIEYANATAEAKITEGTYKQNLTNPNGLTVNYSSSDETVATITADGTVTLKKTGETIITATFTENDDYEGAFASYTLTVIKDTPVLSFQNSIVNVSFDGSTYKQEVTTTPEGLAVEYSSSDETVGTVAEDGTVTLLTEGTITITATFAGNELYESAEASYTLKAAVDFATLPFNYNGGKSKLPTGLTHNGLGSDYSSNSAPDSQLKFDDTGDYLVLKFNEAPGVLSYYIKGNNFSGGTFTVQSSADGETYTQVKTYNGTVSSGSTETIKNLAETVRYIKWIYTKKSTGNVGLGKISLTKKYVDVKFASSGYASYCSPFALDLTPSDDYAAYAVTATSGNEVVFTKIPGAVPATTPFILYGKEMGGQTISLPVATGETTAVEGNMLVGTLEPTAVTQVNGDYTNFGLSNGAFVKISDGTLPANKAYLPILTANVPTTSGARLSIVFADETTGISQMADGRLNVENGVFDLQGRRMESSMFNVQSSMFNVQSSMFNVQSSMLKKGLYIVNGKKVIVK